MRVIIAPAAQRDIDGHIDWLFERSPASAERAGDTLLSALRQLSEFPESGSAVRGSLRRLVIDFGRDGFVAYYRLRPAEVMIERVLHGRQDR